MPTLPTLSNFPPPLRDSILITPPPSPAPPRSLLILLHGLGDTHAPFHTLARQLSLPHTACISLRGPSPLPALFMGSATTGFHWGDDVLLDERTGAIDFDSGFTTCARQLGQLLNALTADCGFAPRDVFFLGFGQGGMVALAAAEAFAATEFGGVVAVGTKLAASRYALQEARGYCTAVAEGGGGGGDAGAKARTPVVVCGGARGSQVTAEVVRGVRERYRDAEYVKWEREGDGMPRSREEMLPIMRFLGRRMRGPVPEGAVEVEGGWGGVAE